MLPWLRFRPVKPGNIRCTPWRAFHNTPKPNFLRRARIDVPALYKPRQESWLTPTMVLLGIMPFFTFALGTWQMQRLKWKINLIDELEEKLQLAPLTLPKRINLSVLPEFIWRKVKITGRWDHAHTMLLTLRVREGIHGVHVVTPLIRSNGTTLLVDRGFVSNDHLQEFLALEDPGEVELLGMLRTSQPRNSFTPDNRPEAGEWYWTDVDAMAQYAGGEEADVQPVFIEEVFEGHAGEAASMLAKGIPIGRPPTVTLRNSHLSYVLTWYLLSGLTTFMFVRLVIAKKRFSGKQLPRF